MLTLAQFHRANLLQAVERYHAALDREHETLRRDGDDAPDDVLDSVVGDRIAAERDLIRLILAVDDDAPERRRHQPRGVTFEGLLYLAAPALDDDTPMGETSGDGTDVMRLSVLDLAAVESID